MIDQLEVMFSTMCNECKQPCGDHTILCSRCSCLLCETCQIDLDIEDYICDECAKDLYLI